MALPDRVGVYGGGRMGAGIAHALLLGGAQVTIVEIDREACARVEAQVAKTLAKAAELAGSDADAVRPVALTTTTDPAALEGCSLVVEAVPEDVELKYQVLQAIERAAPDAVLATNTSALSVDSLAAVLARPATFLGLHFFNPVPASALVEIVVGTRTSPELVVTAVDWVTSMFKTPITVSDSPGFASSRLGVAIALEAMRMLEEGVASAEDIDLAMTLGYRHPVGPLRTTDMVGLDVRLAIADHLHAQLGPRFEPPAILRELVAAGRLGRKTGHGFYDW